MINLIKKTLKYQNIYKKTKNHDDELFKEIVDILEPTTTKVLSKVSFKINSDIYQEILIKINEILIRFKIIKHQYDCKYISSYAKKN